MVCKIVVVKSLLLFYLLVSIYDQSAGKYDSSALRGYAKVQRLFQSLGGKQFVSVKLATRHMNDLKGNDNRIIKERPRYTKNEKMVAEDE